MPTFSRQRLLLFCSATAVCLFANCVFAADSFKTVTVDNAKPRRDVAGEIIDAHDGCLQFFNGRYHLYGTGYGKTAGYSINNRFRVYSSPDLVK